jgi:hypothetical protein
LLLSIRRKIITCSLGDEVFVVVGVGVNMGLRLA